MKRKATKSKLINRILVINLAILLVFSVFITLNLAVFFSANQNVITKRVSRDNLFLSYVYQNLYSEANDCFSEYQYDEKLQAGLNNPQHINDSVVFLKRIVNLKASLADCYIIYKDADAVASSGGIMSKEAFFHNITIKNKDEFNSNLYRSGNIQVYQAAENDGGSLTGVTLFVSAYRDTAMILSYTADTLNELLRSSISEENNHATLKLGSDVICSTLPIQVSKDGSVTAESVDKSEYNTLVSDISGTDFSIEYYKYIGGYTVVNRNIIIISAIFILLLLIIDFVIFYIIRQNFYNPIKKILNKYSGEESTGIFNEYAELDTLITDLQEKYLGSLNTEQELKYENSFIKAFSGDTNTDLSKVVTSYEKYIIVKLVFDSGASDEEAFLKFESSLARKYSYRRITVNEKLSYFIIDTADDTAFDFSEFSDKKAFWLAGISRCGTGAVKLPLEQCERAFACASPKMPSVVYKENLKSESTVEIERETLNSLMDLVIKGNVSGVEEMLKGIFSVNSGINISQMKSMCGGLADMLHILSINTNTLIDSFRSFYTVRDTYNYGELRRQILEMYGEAARINSEKSDRRIIDIIKCVDEEYNTQISLQSLSDRFELPIEQISRLFKKQTGVNFVKYKQQKRIEKAKEMLLEEKSVNEICQYVGFANPSTFIRLFEKNVGVTPGKYKQYVEENNNEK